MGSMFYRLSVSLYGLVLSVVALFNAKAQRFVRGRSRTFEVLQQQMQACTSPIAWFHCASLGEFEQGRPIIEAFRQEFPAYKILLSFFSPSGYEVRKNYPLADFIHYLPLDTRGNATRWVELVKPEIAFFIKYEFWHYYIQSLASRNIPILSVSSIFREDQLYFRDWGGFQRKILKNISHFFVQDQKSMKLLQQIGISNVSLTGDTRFDRVFDICQKATEIEGIEEFAATKKVMVIGSSWPEDMEVLYPFISANDLKYIIAPHEIGTKSIEDTRKKAGKKAALFSEGHEAWLGKDLLIIDNVGMLSRLYRYGDYAYVGGAFGKGLHNILEAATFGLPVFFGNKNYLKFKEAVELEAEGGAFPVGSYKELQAAFENLNRNGNLKNAGQVSATYVKRNTGATGEVIKFTKKLLS